MNPPRWLRRLLRARRGITPPPGLVVVKVGGSLYDDPRLGIGLRSFVDSIVAPRVLIVAGGGVFGEAVRDLDRWQTLPAEQSHRLALLACRVSAEFLQTQMGLPWHSWHHGQDWWNDNFHIDYGTPMIRIATLDPASFGGCIPLIDPHAPQNWDLTTDSIAALAARVANARLVLLKSVDIPPGTPWDVAAANGWVDRYFPTALGDPPIPVEAINFRRWLDEHFTPAGEP